MSILTVRQITALLRDTVENGFPYVWVRGEVTNLSRPTSGHVYFSLKDDNALLQAVWFKNDQKAQELFDPLTGEVFEDGPRVSLCETLRNGQHVICAGRLTVYAPRGSYQLVVELAQDNGEGQLHLELQALRNKLEAQGYFRLARKRELPEHPLRVSVITAPTGAAIQDFLRLASERGYGASIDIHPVPVQGDEAPSRIVAALEAENRRGWAEVLVLIRGGGSLQDLWAFNDERVADAVFASRLPVVAGIGHEVDTSLADMTADVRAATPSHAAQLLWPERRWYAQLVDDGEAALRDAAEHRLARELEHVERLQRTLGWLSPKRGIFRREERLREAQHRLDSALQFRLRTEESRWSTLSVRLDRCSPGPALEQRLRDVANLSNRLKTGQETLLHKKDQLCENTEKRLSAALLRKFESLERRMEHHEARLLAHDPLRPLKRGYACVHGMDGQLIRSVRDVPIGTSLTVTLNDGTLDARVTAVHTSGECHETV